MSTGAEFANFVLKRLAGSTDFSTRFLDFLLANQRELASRVFAFDGVFDQPLSMSGSGADEITITQPVNPRDFRGFDGIGNIIGLEEAGSEDATAGQIKVLPVENTAATTYYVSMQYAERPSGISINPRTGMPEYSKITQAVGVAAAPDAVVDNVGTLTFTIDSACEAGHSHAGRTAIVFMVTPDRGGITEAIAIESLTVSWNGSNNRITTTGVFGQSTVSTTASDYMVVLLGPTVRKVDTVSVSGHLYIGSFVGTGAGNPPGSISTTGQNLIDQFLGSLTAYPGGGNWADGTTNPATTIILQISKIISDLTSTSGARGLGKLTAPAFNAFADSTANPAARADQAVANIINSLISTSGGRGLAKLTAAARAAWADGTTNVAARADEALAKIITDLTSTSGQRGLGKLTAPAFSAWADTTANPAANADAAHEKIITDLTSTTGQRGAGKLTAPARSAWADAATNPAARVDEALEKIITDLTSTSTNRGAGKITGAIDVTWHDSHAFVAGTVHSQLVSIVEDLTIDGKGSDRIDAEAIASTLRGSIPAGAISLALGSIKDQLAEIVQELALPKLVGAYAARNYNVKESVIASSYKITDFIKISDGSANQRMFAIGDDGAGSGGAVTVPRTALHSVGGVWGNTGALAGVTETELKGIAHDNPNNYVFLCGTKSGPAVTVQYTGDTGVAAWTEVTIPSGGSSTGKAAFYSSVYSSCLVGLYQQVAATGPVIAYSANASTGSWLLPSTLPSTPAFRGVYAFAENTGQSVVVAGGIDGSGNAMIARSTGGIAGWSDVTPSGAVSASVRDLVYDAVRDIFWAILSNGDMWYSSSAGTGWTKLANGCYSSFKSISVCPYTGVLVMADGPNPRITVSVDGGYGDEIAAGEEIHWDDIGRVKWLAGRFMIVEANNLLVGGSIAGGDRPYLYLGVAP